MPEIKTLGRYEIIGELGRGGMGVVMKARDPRIDRMIALKIIRRSEGIDQQREKELLERFYLEAKAAGKLTHPNIVTIYDVGEEKGMSWIAMEFVEGRDLAGILAEEKRLSFKRSAGIIMQVAEGLGFAHEAGIVHRDIKPGNILVQTGDRIKITDFGLARLQSAGSVTQTGHAVGSPLYMSPEQVQGAHVDGRSDIFSLGVMFYEMLTGARPFEGESITSIIFKIMKDNPPSVDSINRDLPHDVDCVIAKMMAKEREDRYQSCREAAKDLEKISFIPGGFMSLSESDAALTVDIKSPPPRVGKDSGHGRRGRSGFGPMFVALLVLALLAGSEWWYFSGGTLPFMQPVVRTPSPVITHKSADIPDKHGAKPDKPVVKTPLVGKISVTSPVEGNVTIDGVRAGKTPLENFEVKPGRRMVEFSAPLRKPWKKIVTVAPGDGLAISVKPEFVEGSLMVESVPPVADVFIGGKKEGVTPLRMDYVKPGKIMVEIVKPGYDTYKKTAIITSANPVSISASLKRSMGTISIAGTDGGVVYINGKKSGRIPYTKSLATGVYKVEIRKSRFKPFSKTVTVRKNKTSRVTGRLKELGFGSIRISAIPWAGIIINGKKAGTTPRLVEKVMEGNVTVKLVNPGFKPFVKKVRLQKGQTLLVTHTFRSSEALRASRKSTARMEKTGSLKIVSRPEGVVFIDGKLKGATPVFVKNLEVGRHKVIVKRNGLPDYHRKVNIVEGIVTRLAIEK